MPVRKDPSGERSVEVEVEVPGTPEEVWKAIATGPGISAWFVPTTCDEKVGGNTTCNFGPGMESVAAIKKWDPPRSFVAEAEEGVGSGPVATEWIVEARQGGTCVVRVVHRWFASTDEWDQQFEGHTHGWKAFFRILRLYLAHFAGARCTPVALSSFSTAPLVETWSALLHALGVDPQNARLTNAVGAPPFAATIESRATKSHPELLLRLDTPAPGLVHIFPMPMGGQVLYSARFYLYGDGGAAAAPSVERDWTAWLAKVLG